VGTDIPILAGTASTVLFAGSVLPMLVKAVRTRDLSSYSLGNILTANVGNAVYAVYVYSLPRGPIWFLHAFYIASSGLMLFWWFRFRHEGATEAPVREAPTRERVQADGVGPSSPSLVGVSTAPP
jgi:hypothetical protein